MTAYLSCNRRYYYRKNFGVVGISLIFDEKKGNFGVFYSPCFFFPSGCAVASLEHHCLDRQSHFVSSGNAYVPLDGVNFVSKVDL